jgi:hypothetical protein
MSPRFHDLVGRRQPIGTMLGRRIGELFSTLRHVIFDRLIDLERSYRGTLLGFHHGLAVARLLREVAERLDEQRVVAFCDEWLPVRGALVDAAERELHWFADAPHKAIRSGFRSFLQPTRRPHPLEKTNTAPLA